MRIDSTCRAASVLLVNTDPLRSAETLESDVDLSFTNTSAETWNPAVELDGDEITGLASGSTVDIRVVPPGGRETGTACVDFTIHTGDGDPLSGSVDITTLVGSAGVAYALTANATQARMR